MGLSFRTARKLWMGLVAVLSLASISLAVVLWVHGYSKSNTIGALIAIPCFASVGAIWTILKKIIFSPQIVCVEATWVFALLPFQIRKSGATWYGALLIIWSTVLGLFVFESDGTLRSRFSPVYQVLEILVWINAALVFLYAAGVILLALLTQLSYDREIWSRDIDSSPCPFPFPVLLVYALPFTNHFGRTMVDSQQSASNDYCLPGCTCHTKPTEPPGLHDERTNRSETTQTPIPIRVPTVMERLNVVRVTLGNMAR